MILLLNSKEKRNPLSHAVNVFVGCGYAGRNKRQQQRQINRIFDFTLSN